MKLAENIASQHKKMTTQRWRWKSAVSISAHYKWLGSKDINVVTHKNTESNVHDSISYKIILLINTEHVIIIRYLTGNFSYLKTSS